MTARTILTFTCIYIFTAVKAQYNTVTVYDQCNYSGHKYSLGPGNYQGYQMKIKNDRLSSMKIPAGMKVTIYEHDNFKGRSNTFTSDMYCLPPDWVNMASSIVVESEYPQGSENDYVTFFNDCYAKGYSQSLRPGKYSGTQLGSLKQNISSFTIHGNLQVKLYVNNEYYTGYATTHTTSETCLGSNENDKASSIIIEYRTTPASYPPNGNPGNSYATVYADCYYNGSSLRLEPGYYQGDKLGLLRYNISSIELPSNLRARVFINNETLSGTSYNINESLSCLSTTLNNKIGSLIIENAGYSNPSYPVPDQSVVIYTDNNYRGQSASLLPGTYATMALAGFPDDALSSLTLPPGYRVVLYEHPNFGGKSYTITQSKPGFLLSNWNDKTSSIAVYRE